ncbi:MAG: YlmC/YmxH family sporulation protein [Clostridia bacterium]|nr:YlmC/YmxH family sporulation protein [Clostridia bacterium]
MFCRITDMHDKEVINVCDGMRLGCVDDVEVDTCTAQLVSIVIYGRAKCMGILGHEDDIVIGWKEIEVIGEHTILVNHPVAPGLGPGCKRRKNSILRGIFGNF